MPRMVTHPATATGPTYIGSRLVFPGETVFIEDDAGVKMVDAPASITAAEVDIAALQKLKVAEITLELPELKAAQLEALLDLEQRSPQPRSTLVSSIETRLLALKAAPDAV